nr:MAG TPA: hypothetical protein [Caudoviricetes sp.]
MLISKINPCAVAVTTQGFAIEKARRGDDSHIS